MEFLKVVLEFFPRPEAFVQITLSEGVFIDKVLAEEIRVI